MWNGTNCHPPSASHCGARAAFAVKHGTILTIGFKSAETMEAFPKQARQWDLLTQPESDQRGGVWNSHSTLHGSCLLSPKIISGNMNFASFVISVIKYIFFFRYLVRRDWGAGGS